MSLDIQIGSEFLRLPPGTTLELEQENPFLQFSDEQRGDYSLPLDVKLVPENLRLLQYAGLLQARVSSAGIDAKIFDNGLQYSIGKLKVEKPITNLNHMASGTISLYYLSGWSGFWQDIKGAKLRDVELGGDRSFAWDDANRNGPGFWGHIHRVIDAPAGYGTSGYDYAFYPIINKAWEGQWAKTDVMNYMEYTGGTVNFKNQTTDGKYANVIVPFPYLRYVLDRAVAHIGWRIEGEALQDEDFLCATMVNFRAITWAVVVRGFSITVWLPTITFNLQDHMPDMEIAEFLLALKNRFGWWFDFDRKSKVIRVRYIREVATTATKDMTAYAAPVVPRPIVQEPKVYALKNQFVGEYANGKPDFRAVSYKGEVAQISNLPTPGQGLYAHVYLVIAENNYYICRQNDSNAWQWQRFAYNVYDVEPENATEEVITAATTLGSEYFSDYLDLCPRMDQVGEWFGQSFDSSEWGIHLLFYKGKRNNKLGQPVPFATSGVYDSAGVQVAQWSLAFECRLFDGREVGLYQTNWKPLLDLLGSPEELEVTLYLPKEEWLNLRFSDAIIIAGVKMYIKKIYAQLPYKESVRLECIRI